LCAYARQRLLPLAARRLETLASLAIVRLDALSAFAVAALALDPPALAVLT
jgi:hypothetical protein